MIKRIKLKLIIIEIITLFFLISGIKRIQIATQSDVYEAVFSGNSIEPFTDLTMGEFLTYQLLWPFGIFVAGVIIIGLMNWRYKTSVLNTVIVFIIVFSLFPLGIMHRGFIQRLFNSLGSIFSDNTGTAFYTSGIILTIIALVFMWVCVTLNKKNRAQFVNYN